MLSLMDSAAPSKRERAGSIPAESADACRRMPSHAAFDFK
jgi:hypothetical protein